MKEAIVDGTIAKMSGCLTPAQLYELRKTLEQELSGYEIVVAPCQKERTKQANEELLGSFISAKRIEGCSEKTLNYYQNTISAWLATVNIEMREVTTNDIRRYLSEFQAKNNSSKTTIDNIRRIFSSFFSWLEDEDYIVKSPVRRIHKVRSEITVKETISDEQLETLRDSCSELRDLAMIDFLVSTGVRVENWLTSISPTSTSMSVNVLSSAKGIKKERSISMPVLKCIFKTISPRAKIPRRLFSFLYLNLTID